MLQFIKAQEVENAGITLTKPQDSSLSGEMLGRLTMLVVNRFLESVEWDDVVSIYLAGLVDDEDEALIQRAVRVLMEGGVQFNAVSN